MYSPCRPQIGFNLVFSVFLFFHLRLGVTLKCLQGAGYMAIGLWDFGVAGCGGCRQAGSRTTGVKLLRWWQSEDGSSLLRCGERTELNGTGWLVCSWCRRYAPLVLGSVCWQEPMRLMSTTEPAANPVQHYQESVVEPALFKAVPFQTVEQRLYGTR